MLSDCDDDVAAIKLVALCCVNKIREIFMCKMYEFKLGCMKIKKQYYFTKKYLHLKKLQMIFENIFNYKFKENKKTIFILSNRDNNVVPINIVKLFGIIK